MRPFPFRAAVAALAVLAAPALAQDEAAIAAVIGDQLDAFNDRDLARAFGHASPMIQAIFGNPGNFGLMVQNGYPMVWSNGGADFLDLRLIEGQLWQRVLLRDGQGGSHLLEYQMIELSGAWRINGVVILPAPDVGV